MEELGAVSHPSDFIMRPDQMFPNKSIGYKGGKSFGTVDRMMK